MTEPFNLSAVLLDEHLAAGRGDRPALRYEGATLSYRDVSRLVARTGSALRSLGVDMEDRVALLLPDSPEFVATFLGAIRIGAVPVTLSTYLTSDEYAELLADCRARVLVAHASVMPRITPIRRGLAQLRHVVISGGDHGEDVTYEEITRTQPDTLAPEATTADDMAFWQYSSGTTGRPKAVVHLHGPAVAPADLHGRHVVEMRADDRVLSVAKLFFSYGLGASLLIPFRHGASSILLPGRPEPRPVFETIARDRPTLLYSVPTSYAALLAVPESERLDASSLRRCISAGESLPAPIFERWRARFGLEILDGIGSTEIGYIAISNFPGRVRAGTSGQVIPGYDVRVQRADGEPAAVDEVGDLLVRGPSTAAFYWRRRAATKHTFRGEWVFTGDRYSVDADGYYTNHGRSDDLLRVSGHWVSPLEVESVLLRHAAVRECAVVARADRDGLTKPCAYVVCADGIVAAPALADELKIFVKDALAPYKYPRWVEFIPELPKTSTGKIQRFKLRQTSQP
ncbi:MAG TPA: benzoate-CoA ligase family protein [Candidatus Limnocylindria bacterium]|nr:benzoate-CoA ligase family protein [Candidatus Limnocylindria bacterium]